MIVVVVIESSALGAHHFGEGSGDILLDDVKCIGNEERLLDCPSNDIGDHSCVHFQDASVVCYLTSKL